MTAVLSKLIVIISVFEPTLVNPVPPVNVRELVVLITWLKPVSGIIVNDAFATESETKLSTYSFVVACVLAEGVGIAITPENVLFPDIVWLVPLVT